MFSGWSEYRLIEDRLAELVKDLPASDISDIIGYVLCAPGKRVRPLIVLFSAKAFGGAVSDAVDVALAVELVHVASLVHDDILDFGIERRGEPSTFQRFGAEASLLAGDFLISKSIELLSHYSQPIIESFAKACMSMAEGEMLDLSRAYTSEDYYRCISKKTASLFAVSARIGGLLSGAPENDISHLEGFGRNLGIAYQVLDDLEEHLGLYQGKVSKKTSVTLPKIYGQRLQEDSIRDMCIKAIEDHSLVAKKELAQVEGSSEMIARLVGIVDEMTLRGLDKCRLLKSLC